MTDTGKKERPAEAPKRGEAAWRAAKEAIATRNEQASRRSRARRQAAYELVAARQAAADKLERAELAKRRP